MELNRNGCAFLMRNRDSFPTLTVPPPTLMEGSVRAGFSHGRSDRLPSIDIVQANMKHKRFERGRDISLSQGGLVVVHAALDSSEGRGGFHSIGGGLDRTERTCSTASTTIQYVTLLSGQRAQRRATGARIIPSLGSIFSAQKVRAYVIKPRVIVPAQLVLQKVS
jgi:hypothetical protein